MEGFAVLRAAQMAGVPAIEVRVISNEIEQDGPDVAGTSRRHSLPFSRRRHDSWRRWRDA